MSKLLFGLFFLVVLAFSCKKDSNESRSGEGSRSVAGATVVGKGELTFYSENATNGIVKFYKQPDGKIVLALEQMNIESKVDLELYLSTDATINQDAIKLFSFKSVNGTLYYDIPAGIDISDFSYVVIHNDISDTPVATAIIG